MENDQICIWLFLWSTLNLRYVLCSDLDFLRFRIFFMGYSYFLFFEIPGHIICPFSFVYWSFVFGFTAASWHGIWIFHWDKWIDVFTASRFAVLFKMPSSLSWTLVSVASAVLAWTRLSSDTCATVSWTPSTASASRVGQLHSFVVVIQSVWMLFVLLRLPASPRECQMGAQLGVRPPEQMLRCGPRSPLDYGKHQQAEQTNTCPRGNELSWPYNPVSCMLSTSALKSPISQGFTTWRPFHHLM